MSTRDALLHAILTNPADFMPRLVYADWLEEQGDPQAELFRLQYALTQSADVAGRRPLEAKQQQLLDAGAPPAVVPVTNSIGMQLALFPPGEFWMGSPETELERFETETLRRVRITQPVFFGIHEVTQGEFQQVMGYNPSFFRPGDRVGAVRDTTRFPVEMVSWFDAVEFCNRLSQREDLVCFYDLTTNERVTNGSIEDAHVATSGGTGYRLPTNAEWEYACRAGTTTVFHFGDQFDPRRANVEGGYPYGAPRQEPHLGRSAPVGSYPPNAFGLYDMHGNVLEWCQDWVVYDTGERAPIENPFGPNPSKYRSVRGGSWYRYPWRTRAACPFRNAEFGHDRETGFRIVRFA